MRLPLFFTVLLFSTLSASSQKKPQPHSATAKPKYTSLLWEITGNGLKKPSYLFGTMHVSNKLAFNMGDSFYHAIRSADVVALETNPEDWQEDFSTSIFTAGARSVQPFYRQFNSANSYLTINTLAIDNYIEKVKASLPLEPSLINGFLYRTVGQQMADFEEDTFVDLYIMQIGRKLGKRLAGVENFHESEKLVLEASMDMMKDQNKKKRSYDYENAYANPKKLEEAYRNGDLDLLDSLQALSVFSDAYQEKFLYKRNEIQANSIDSILRKSTLFVGVGAAHLPGRRGVIEMLRAKGYKLRPVKMDQRNSVQKDELDKIRFAHQFQPQKTDDAFIEVSIPGKKFYHFTEWPGMDVVQYADMVNGAYYMITRVKTNATMWSHDPAKVHQQIDSMLYENIPGKILKKTAITKNGYPGWDVENRTRRGDHQRYQIFATPFEVIVFKMSGTGEYVKAGKEADEFFGSIKLKEFANTSGVHYQPTQGGFNVKLPHEPSVLKDNVLGGGRIEYAAYDAKQGISYLLLQSNIHNYSFIEEDSFELDLLDESYAHSEFVSKLVRTKKFSLAGYPAIESRYLHKDGSYSTARQVIRGPVYYSLVVKHKKDDNAGQEFLESFQLSPFRYPANRLMTDSNLHFQAMAPAFKEDSLGMQVKDIENWYMKAMQEEDEEEYSYRFSRETDSKYRLIGNDSTGEKISVSYVGPEQYIFKGDTATAWDRMFRYMDMDSSFIYGPWKESFSDSMKIRETYLRDTNSSRQIWVKWIYKNGHSYKIVALTDTVMGPSGFVKEFFSSFSPVGLNHQPIHQDKSVFFKDFFNKDSVIAKKARRYVDNIEFDSTDVTVLKDAILRLNWGHRNYIDQKVEWINELGWLKNPEVLPFLKSLYKKAGDTAQLQNAILDAMLRQRTKESFLAFKEIMLDEPPIREFSSSYSMVPPPPSMPNGVTITTSVDTDDYGPEDYRWLPLYDTMSLTRSLFPEILGLLNIDDYKQDVIELMSEMVDSGYLKAADYESYFTKFQLEGKQLLKKQINREDKFSMRKADKKNEDKDDYYSDYDEDAMNSGNRLLSHYAVLLLPFYKTKESVVAFFDQLIRSTDKRLQYSTMMLLNRNKYPVPDSLLVKFAADDEYKPLLYQDLKYLGMVDRFPAKYKDKQGMAKSLLLMEMENKPDSIVFLDKLPATYKGEKGFVYFYKVRQMKDDVKWQLVSAGFQPEDPNGLKTNDLAYFSNEERVLEKDEPVKQQLQKFLKEMINAERPSASEFYDDKNYNLFKSYLSEMVKSRRFTD